MDKVGEQYEGMISSITSFGIFVQLPNTVEGLISLKDLDDDYYEFNPQHMVLIGRNRGNIYRIGQKVTIEVTAVDIDERNIDFKLIKAEPMEGMKPISLPKQKSKKDKNNRPKSKKDFQRATGREKAYSKSKNSKNKASKSSTKKSFKIRKRGR
ncbi:S1 RNA-binding domain-containing protein [Globicatella sp. PHS-GS-PNBC-21-1553]|nr:S1 RNA-binding domain-containing protein [Globicatella sp. PHS-GS-PNBC-21-1553]